MKKFVLNNKEGLYLRTYVHSTHVGDKTINDWVPLNKASLLTEIELHHIKKQPIAKEVVRVTEAVEHRTITLIGDWND